MRVKRPLDFRMAPKKSSNGNGVDAELTLAEGLVPSKCSDSDLENLISDDLLLVKSVI